MNPLESPDTLNAHLAEQPGVALYFSAPGCGVCSVLKPRLHRITSYNVCYTKLLRLGSETP